MNKNLFNLNTNNKINKENSLLTKFNINYVVSDKNNNNHLSAVFGQYHINLNEFNKKLNLIINNNKFISDLVLPIKILKKTNLKDYTFIIKKISLKTILENFLFLKYNLIEIDLLNLIKDLNVELIFDIIKFYNYIYNYNNLTKSAKLVLSYLSSNVFIKKIII